MKNKIVIITIFFLTSCITIPHQVKNAQCSVINQELALRYSIFEKLDDEEIARRQTISVHTYSILDDFSVFSKIVESVKNAPMNAKMIPVDLRNYLDVGLGNIIITNYASDTALNIFLHNSKYSQGFFALINFGRSTITLIPPPSSEVPTREKIYRTDLNDSEIVINVSDAKNIAGNMKFSPNQKTSIIADRIKQPYRLDLRENSNTQFHLGNQWIMPVYSVENSDLNGGKVTAGFFQFINNSNSKGIVMDKFDKSEVLCYSDEKGPKFRTQF
ncbi:MAG: hypothetical protein K0R25_875 [Rickettsiaceae bacterium]|jgi:hypothetical protein|nr:hypothetical protein [Rickettsiaceae bacterium]